MKPADVLLLTHDDETAAAVEGAVRSSSLRMAVTVCKTVPEIRSQLAKTDTGDRRAIAIIDIDDGRQQVLYELGKTVTAHPSALFVVISREFNENLVLQAMQVGARHFLRKTAIASELDAVLGRLLLTEPQAATKQGDVISVLSCSGGCGATTVAVNLAAEFKLAREKPVLIVDLDSYYGPVGHHLGVQGSYGIAHILNRQGPIDRHVIESSVVHFTGGIDVLLSPAAAQADREQPMKYDQLSKVLDACRESYGYVIVDAPRLPREVVSGLAAASRVVVIVLRPTIRDVGFAKSIIASLAEAGPVSDRILVLANQAGNRSGLLSPAEIRKALAVTAMFPVRTDWRKAIASMNRQQPLADFARWSGVRRDLRRAAHQVLQWMPNGHLERGDA
jgi:pilus assembly protein CpaE